MSAAELRQSWSGVGASSGGGGGLYVASSPHRQSSWMPDKGTLVFLLIAIHLAALCHHLIISTMLLSNRHLVLPFLLNLVQLTTLDSVIHRKISSYLTIPETEQACLSVHCNGVQHGARAEDGAVKTYHNCSATRVAPPGIVRLTSLKVAHCASMTSVSFK